MAAKPVVIPQSGVVEEVVVVEWMKTNGEIVTEGDPIVTIESEKAEMNIEAPASGRLEILVEANFDREVPVGTTLGSVVT